MSGFSITLVFGRWGGIYAHWHSETIRLCLGYVALTIYPKTDIEAFVQMLRCK